jgi:hypothetical protein
MWTPIRLLHVWHALLGNTVAAVAQHSVLYVVLAPLLMY